MKKALIIIGGIIGVVLIAMIAIPFFFKDEIKAKIDSELQKTVNAQVLYNADKFSLSLFKHFPNITISVGDFGLVAKKEEFKGDTLFKAETFNIVADIMSVITGDKIKIKGITLDKPLIKTIMAANGANSWDLMIANPADTAQAPDSSDSSSFAVGIEKWEINDGTIIYDDRSLPMYAELKHVDHKGSGDLTQEEFDMDTYTKSPDTRVVYDGVTYLNKHAVQADMKMKMNYAKMEFAFLENQFKINDFKFGFDGKLSMPGDDIVMDIKYAAKETEFKNLISLIPAVFMEGYDKLKAEGKIAFDGTVKGTFNETSMPGFSLNMNVKDAMMQYPDLPSSLKNIAMDLKVDNKDGIIDNTVINLSKFHVDMGSNPIDAKALVEGLNPYKIDANVLAKVNLEEITKMFPIDSTTLKGLFSVDVKAKGVYSDSLKLMPVVDAKMGLQNGYVKTASFPSALENVNLSTRINSAGQTSSTKIWLDFFKMVLDGEPFEAKAYVENLDNAAYDVSLKGIIDLTKMTKIYPLEGMTVSGRINADIQTKGVMSDIEAGKYDKTSTSGTMSIKDLKYNSPDMPQGMSISAANFTLAPEKITISNMDGYLGKSDFSVKGYFANYMGYMFGTKDTIIRGNMTFASKKFDTNEWMTEDSTATTTTTTEESSVFEVPKDVDFFMASSLNEVLYDKMTMTNMTGNIIMKDGILKMDKLNFNTLGGSILTNGTYNTQDINHPKFGFDLDMKNIGIKPAFEAFNTVQKLAPTAQNMDGSFNSKMTLNGDLGKDMMPVYSTLTGNGNVLIADAKVKDNKVLSGISTVTQMKGLNPLELKDVNIKFKIENGDVVVDPFDIKAGNMKMNVAGRNNLDGTIKYLVKMDVPAGSVGAALNGGLSKLTGNNNTSQNIKLDLNVGGTYNDPKVSLAGSDMKEQVKEQIKNEVKDQITNSDEAQKAKAEADRLRKEAEDKKKAEEDRLKKEAEDRKKAEEARLKQEADKKAQDLLKKKIPKF